MPSACKFRTGWRLECNKRGSKCNAYLPNTFLLTFDKSMEFFRYCSWLTFDWFTHMKPYHAHCLSIFKEILHLKGRLCCKLPIKMMQNWVIQAAFQCLEDNEFSFYSSIQMIWYNILAGCTFSNTIKLCSTNDVEKHIPESLAQLQRVGGRVSIGIQKRKNLRGQAIFSKYRLHIHVFGSHSFIFCAPIPPSKAC